jgi:hypothetical protein
MSRAEDVMLAIVIEVDLDVSSRLYERNVASCLRRDKEARGKYLSSRKEADESTWNLIGQGNEAVASCEGNAMMSGRG